MKRPYLLAMTLLAAIACKDGVNPDSGVIEKSTDGVSASGVVYGFTAAPDSQRVELADAAVTLIRISDLPPPPPPGTDTLTSVGRAGVLDSVVPPPDTTQPPPPAGCDTGSPVAETRTGGDGSWSLTGLEQGIYNVRIDAPSGTQWRSIEYCGWVVQNSRNELTLYLPLGSGPDLLP